MDPQDAVRFFRAMKIRGTRAEIQAACAPYGYLPLALRLLAGLVAEDPARPGDVAVATEYEITEDLRGREQHHILERAYDALDPAARDLLSRIAAFRSPVEYDVLEAIFTTPVQPPQPEGLLARLFTRARKQAALLDRSGLKATLQSLQRRGLLLRQEGTGRYDLHPVVRRYGYDRLADKEGTHTRLRDYFAAVPPPERVESLDDLAPTIELYHHTVRAGRYDEAWTLYRDRLWRTVYYRFGAYQTQIELLQALFLDGEDRPPRLKDEAHQAHAMNELANSYSLSGQPGRAVTLFKAHNALREKAGDKKNLAIGLCNLAYQHIAIGALAAAEGNLRRMIALCQEIGDEFSEAIGHQELGRLLAYTGAFEEARTELRDARKVFDALGVARTNWVSVVRAYEALLDLREGDSDSARDKSQQALELAQSEARSIFGGERDIIRAEWLLGAAHRARGELTQAESHLAEALRRCRRINMVDHEPLILLELARLRYAQMVSGSRFQVSGSGEEQPETLKPETKKRKMDEALSLAKEALDIAERCGYRLVQADGHLVLAQLALSEVEGLALEAGDLPDARRHAEAARERAWCDGPPHRYEAPFLEAERLLEEIGSLKH
jgi:tetratricopeptide (TPR) repeat protein